MASHGPSLSVCTFYLRNACVHGDECRFYHPSAVTQTTRSRPSELGGGGDPQAACPHFAQGACRFGDRCRLSHSRLSPRPRAFVSNEPASSVVSTQACAFFARGACRFGDACRLGHSAAVPAKSAVSHPKKENGSDSKGISAFGSCKFFIQGICRKGALCPFPHVPVASLGSPERSLRSQPTPWKVRAHAPLTMNTRLNLRARCSCPPPLS